MSLHSKVKTALEGVTSEKFWFSKNILNLFLLSIITLMEKSMGKLKAVFRLDFVHYKLASINISEFVHMKVARC